MKLSEAMMLGSTTMKMIRFDLRSCALGAAANAIGIPAPLPESRHLRGMLIAEVWPWITARYVTRNPWSTYGSHIAQEFNEGVCGGRISFEALVDHVRSIEPECGECNRFECICVCTQHDAESEKPSEDHNSQETAAAEKQQEEPLHELLLSGKTFTRNGVTFTPKSSPGPISSNSGGGSEQKKSEPKPYLNQEAMEACMKRNPALTEEEFKEMAEAFGF